MHHMQPVIIATLTLGEVHALCHGCLAASKSHRVSQAVVINPAAGSPGVCNALSPGLFGAVLLLLSQSEQGPAGSILATE